MDKELLRIVIIAVGITVILGMILWAVFKNKKAKGNIDFYDKGNPLDNIDNSLVIDTGNDEFDIEPVSLGSALDDELDPLFASDDVTEEPERVNAVEIPAIIQFSLVAKTEYGFNGSAIETVFQQLGLEYGSMKIFERLDDQRRVDFAVASMIEPGTFPESGMDTFNSPGLVFFMQPRELDNPLETFEEFIQAINLLATELDGDALDQNRQLLTEETIQQFRNILQ